MRSLLPVIILLVCTCKGGGGDNLQILNLSLPRSGTTSLAQIFISQKSTHEFMMADSVFTIMDYREHKISRNDLIKFLKKRAQMANHSVDSATFLFLEPEIVIEAFPDAKFFFALRPCEDWIVSMVDRFNTIYRMQRAGVNLENIKYMDRFGMIFSRHLSPEVFNDVPTIQKHAADLVSDLAKFWSHYTLRVLESMRTLKPNQRLIIHLKDLSNSLERLSAFSDVPLSLLNARQTHTNKDTHSRETRAILGETMVRRAASVEQNRVDLWLKSHPDLLVTSQTQSTVASGE